MEQLSSSVGNMKLNSEFIAKTVVRLMKHDIFNRYKQTRELTKEDEEFCEQIDWHPVDELPINEEYAKELLKD